VGQKLATPGSLACPLYSEGGHEAERSACPLWPIASR